MSFVTDAKWCFWTFPTSFDLVINRVSLLKCVISSRSKQSVSQAVCNPPSLSTHWLRSLSIRIIRGKHRDCVEHGAVMQEQEAASKESQPWTLKYFKWGRRLLYHVVTICSWEVFIMCKSSYVLIFCTLLIKSFRKLWDVVFCVNEKCVTFVHFSFKILRITIIYVLCLILTYSSNRFFTLSSFKKIVFKFPFLEEAIKCFTEC